MKKYKVINTNGNRFKLGEIVTDELENILIDDIYKLWYEYNNRPNNRYRIFTNIYKLVQYMHDYQVELINPKLNNNIKIL